MSVLPQLQQELSAAHGRRRRRLPRIGFGLGSDAAPVVLSTVVAVAIVVVAVALVRSGRPPERPAGSSAIVFRGFAGYFYAARGSLYGITSDRPDSSPSSGSIPPPLIRIDPGSGRVVARQLLAPPSTPQGQPIPEPEHLLLAAGSLWASATDSQQTWLWRLDPSSLIVRSRTVLPGGGAGTYSGSLAAAGGWLWVVNRDTLVRVSLSTGRVAGTRTFSRAMFGQGNGVVADASGRTLILVVAGAKTGWRVESLNPQSGAPIASSRTFSGGSPTLAGVVDGGAWISRFEGGAVRIDLRTLNVTARVGHFPQAAQVLDGVVAVGPEGHAVTGCVDPVTGRTLAPLPDVVAADGSTAYAQRERRGIPEIRRQALDPRCLPPP